VLNSSDTAERQPFQTIEGGPDPPALGRFSASRALVDHQTSGDISSAACICNSQAQTTVPPAMTFDHAEVREIAAHA
jgi:hypothetical protein